MNDHQLKLDMPMPENPTLRFLSYGIFRPGQLGFLQLKELTEKAESDAVDGWSLWLRQGMSVLVPADNGCDRATGIVLTFEREHEMGAYQRICDMQPQYGYAWAGPLVTQSGVRVNCLVGRVDEEQPDTIPGLSEQLHFDLEKDRFHDEALRFLTEQRETKLLRTFQGWDSLFQLETLYILLWSSIERYLTMRYRLYGEVRDKLRLMGRDEFLQQVLDNTPISPHVTRRSDNPSFARASRSDKAFDLLLYYYQIRCNLVHHGKEGDDYGLLYDAFNELLPAFKKTADHAYEQSKVKADASR